MSFNAGTYFLRAGYVWEETGMGRGAGIKGRDFGWEFPEWERER